MHDDQPGSVNGKNEKFHVVFVDFLEYGEQQSNGGWVGWWLKIEVAFVSALLAHVKRSVAIMFCSVLQIRSSHVRLVRT